MSTYDLLSLVLALTAIVISAVSLSWVRRLAKQHFDLRSEQGRLHESQIRLQQEQEALASKEYESLPGHGYTGDKPNQADIEVALEVTGRRGVYSFVFNNVGRAPAYKLRYTIESERSKKPALIQPNFPKEIGMLAAGSSVRIHATWSDNDLPPFSVNLFWEDSQGNHRHRNLLTDSTES